MTQSARPKGFRSFLVIWFGQLVSLTGSGLTGFALGVWVYQRTGSVTHFALISLFTALPGILFSPLAVALASSVGRIIGTGPGRGIGLLYILLGLLGLSATAAAFLYPRLRHVERELPDVVVNT
jgi:hypothetical protein